MVNTAYLSIGSNIGDRKKNLELAIEKLNQVAQVSRLSHIYETEPVGGVKQDDQKFTSRRPHRRNAKC